MLFFKTVFSSVQQPFDIGAVAVHGKCCNQSEKYEHRNASGSCAAEEEHFKKKCKHYLSITNNKAVSAQIEQVENMLSTQYDNLLSILEG